MPVKYRFDTLTITDFRGIHDLEVALPDDFPLHLIGSNNAGKSTILEAVAFALRGGGFHQYDIVPFDFFRAAVGDVAREFEVRLTLKAEREEMLPAVQGVGQPTFVHAVRAKGRTLKSGRMEKNFNLLDGNGKVISFSPRTGLQGTLKTELAGHSGVGWSPISARHDHIRDDLPEVMLLTPKNISQSLFQWKTGPLNRLAAMLAERFLEEKWTFEYKGKQAKMPDGIKSVHSFLSTAVETFPFWKDDLRPKLSATLTSYVGRHTQFELKPRIQELEEWVRQQLLMSFAADERGTVTPIESMGDGWQSLIRLAALDVLSQYPDQVKNSVVLLFEEPETHLHPHLRRRMRTVLERLAAGGWYVVTSTHSPELIDLGSKQGIAKVRRSGDAVTRAQINVSQLTDAIRLQGKINEQGNGEMFFANKVMLCEGKDDEFALKSCLEKMDVDLDGRSVSILGVGGKGNVADYAELLGKCGTPWCAVIDDDRLTDGTYKNNAEAMVQRIEKLRSTNDEILQWSMDLEHCFLIDRNRDKSQRPEYKADPEWQHHQIGSLSAENIKIQYPLLFAVVEAGKIWIER
jgi:Overcoming lysogenization defect protein-like, TOPRIM domain/AAA domain, putative AbiEii toxin, Type IV TA system